MAKRQALLGFLSVVLVLVGQGWASAQEGEDLELKAR